MLISAPSDKLNLLEGSNGPRLACSAEGEPRVQFRWLLLRAGWSGEAKGAQATSEQSPDLEATRSHKSRKHAFLELAADGSAAIHQQHSSSLGRQQSFGANPQASGELAAHLGSDNALLEQREGALPAAGPGELVELTSASYGLAQSSRVGGAGGLAASVSQLDLSSVSMDRAQAGHYICEASNKLGKRRQSVYVNVLCKYTPSWWFSGWQACSSMEMHTAE